MEFESAQAESWLLQDACYSVHDSLESPCIVQNISAAMTCWFLRVLIDFKYFIFGIHLITAH